MLSKASTVAMVTGTSLAQTDYSNLDSVPKQQDFFNLMLRIKDTNNPKMSTF